MRIKVVGHTSVSSLTLSKLVKFCLKTLRIASLVRVGMRVDWNGIGLQ